MRREGLRTAAQARERLGRRCPSSTRWPRRRRSRARRCAAWPGGCWPRPNAGAAPALERRRGARRRARSRRSCRGARGARRRSARPRCPARRAAGAAGGPDRAGARPAGRAPCCWPSRWRCAPGASARCSCADCRRASSRARPAPSRFSPTSAAASWPPPGACACAPREDALAAERYLFYAALSRATERVFLAYRSSDEEGNLALPSPFIADVAELLAADWPARRRRRLLADVVWEPSRAPTEREHARALADCGTAAGGEPPARRRVLGAEALSRMRHTEILSAGALEAYSDCPVRWLIERELQPEPLDPQPEPLTRGSLMHDLLERLLRELDGPVTPDTLAGRAGDPGPAAGRAGRRWGRGARGRQPEVVRAGALRAIEADLRRYLRPRGAHRRAVAPARARAAVRLRGR